MSGRRKATGGGNGNRNDSGSSTSACRVVVHLDLDCYYAQVEQRRLGIPADQPVAVQQWGSLLAVNYVARKFGVLRGEHTSEALKKCPTLHVPHVDTLGENRRVNEVFDRKYQKAILRRYRIASREIFAVLRRLAPMCEKAGIDEAFLDVTQQAQERLAKMDVLSSDFCNDPANEATKVFGISQMDGIGKDAERDMLSGFPLTEEEQLLAVGATIANEIREAVRKELQFTCSTGVATNKLLAKLVSPLNKPDGQTHFPLRKVRGLGGKLGRQLEDLLHQHEEKSPQLPLVEEKPPAEGGNPPPGASGEAQESDKKPKITVQEFMEKLRFEELVKHLGYETAAFVRQVCSGEDGEDPVNEKKTEVKALSSVKQFDKASGDALVRVEELEYWVHVLCEEIVLRCEDERVENKRFPLQLTLYTTRVGEKPKPRKLRIAQSTTVEELFTATMNVLRPNLSAVLPCAAMSMNIKDFVSLDSMSVSSISNFFIKQKSPVTGEEEEDTLEAADSHSSEYQQHEEVKPFLTATQRKSELITMASKRVKISSFFQTPANSSNHYSGDNIRWRQSEPPNVASIAASVQAESASISDPPPLSTVPDRSPSTAAVAIPDQFEEVEDAFAHFRGSPMKGERPSFYCDRCLRTIIESRSEHDDFHFAVDLSRSENRVQAPPPGATKPTSAAGKKRKTGPLDAFLKR